MHADKDPQRNNEREAKQILPAEGRAARQSKGCAYLACAPTSEPRGLNPPLPYRALSHNREGGWGVEIVAYVWSEWTYTALDLVKNLVGFAESS